MKDRIMAFVGNWEPLAFRRRRGRWAIADMVESYEREHSDETIAELKALGINWTIGHFMKGFGLAAEAGEIDKQGDFFRRMHAAGLGVGVYISSNMFWETFLDEVPDAAELAGVQYDGTPVPYFKQYFRWQFCYSSPAYIEYMHKCIDRAVEIDADLLHFDNFNWMPDYDYCHCPHCRAGFRRFLAEKLTGDERKAMLGFESVENILPPPGIHEIRLADEIITDPLMRLWIGFRAESLAAAFADFCDYAKRLKPEMRMEFNGEALACIYNATKMGIDFDRMLPLAWAFWGEDGYAPQVHPNGCIGGRFRSMKMAQAYGSHFFGYAFNRRGETPDGVASNRLLFAEHLAFNHNCVADVGMHDATSGQPDFRTRGPEMALLRANEDVIRDAVTPAEVAVFRNFPSQAYCSIEMQVIPYAIEQMLFLNSIPFEILMDSHTKRLGEFKVVFLAGTLCMTAEQRAAFTAFAAAGGTIICIGDAGQYDLWGRGTESFLAACGLEAGEAPTSATVGKGTVIYRPAQLPAVVAQAKADGLFPKYDEVWTYYPSKLWDAPPDATEILQAVDEATGGVKISHDGPASLIVQPRTVDGATVLHLLQYDATEDIPHLTVTVRGLGRQVQAVQRADFEKPQPAKIDFTDDGETLSIPLKDLRVYAILVCRY